MSFFREALAAAREYLVRNRQDMHGRAVYVTNTRRVARDEFVRLVSERYGDDIGDRAGRWLNQRRLVWLAGRSQAYHLHGSMRRGFTDWPPPEDA